MRCLALTIVLALPSIAHSEPEKTADSPYPRAAAFVIDREVFIVDVPTKTMRPVSLGDLIPEEADLSPDKKLVAVNARPKQRGPHRIYLIEVGPGNKAPIAVPAKGSHRFPRFSPDGKYLSFSAAIDAGVAGHHNPHRIHRMNIDTGVVERVETREGKCEFSPNQLPDGRLASISTSCLIDFSVGVTDPDTGQQEVVASVSGPRSELAVAPSRGTLVYTTNSSSGRRFNAIVPGESSPTTLATVRPTVRRMQPRFVCPGHMLFLNDGRVWDLEASTGKLSEVVSIADARARTAQLEHDDDRDGSGQWGSR